MRTPAGLNCPYYYEDFHRGHSVQECRLIRPVANRSRWGPKLCARCPVPSIVRANACPEMELEAQVKGQWLGFVRRVIVRASCTKYQVDVANPYTGCGRCHPAAATILQPPTAVE